MGIRSRRAAIYVRISIDGEAVENRTRKLRRIARQRGWIVVENYSDIRLDAKTEPVKYFALDQMLKDAKRRKFDIVIVWSIEELGQTLLALLDAIVAIDLCGIDLVAVQQAIDATMPAGKKIVRICRTFANFGHESIQRQIKLGLNRARANGKRLGGKKIAPAIEREVRAQLEAGIGILKTAKKFKLGTATVQRIKREMRSEEARSDS